MKLKLEPIGIVHSPYRNRYEAPPQGGEVSEIVVFDEYEKGLKDIRKIEFAENISRCLLNY